jgi:hypothetical protein
VLIELLLVEPWWLLFCVLDAFVCEKDYPTHYLSMMFYCDYIEAGAAEQASLRIHRREGTQRSRRSDRFRRLHSYG